MSHDRAWWDLGRASSDVIEDTQETFHGVSSAVKTYLGYLCFIFCRNWTRLPNENMYQLAIQYGVYLRLARLRCKYIFSISKCGSLVESATPLVTIDNLPALLAWKGQNHGWRVNLQLIKMSVNTNIFAGKFVFSLRFCRSAVCIRRT